MLKKPLSKLIASLLILLMTVSPIAPAMASAAMVNPSTDIPLVSQIGDTPIITQVMAKDNPKVNLASKTAPKPPIKREPVKQPIKPSEFTTKGAYSINIGQTVSGTLSTSDDTLPDGSYFDIYVFNGTSGQQIAISMNSSAFDTYLELYLYDGTNLTRIAYNNNISSTNLNSRIPTTGYMTLPTTAQYAIIANSWYAGKTGAYTLSLTSTSPNPAYSASGTVKTSSGTAVSGVTMTFTKVSGTGTTIPSPVQSTSTGTWSQSGFATGTTYKVTPTKAGYTIAPSYITFGAATTTANFVATPVTTGYSASGTVKTSSGTAVSGVTMTFAKVSGTGTTVPAPVQSTSAGAWSQSGFSTGTTYKVTPAKAGYSFAPSYIQFSAATTTSNFVATPVSSVPITIGTIKQGALTTSDKYSQYKGTGYYADKYTFTATAGTQVAVSASSKDFDTYLYLTGPTGTLVGRDDSSGEEWDSLIPAQGFYSLPYSGTYTIEVTSFSAGKTGNYTLNVSAPTNYMSSGWVTFDPDAWVYKDSSALAGALITFTRVSGTGYLPSPVYADSTGKWAQVGFASGTTYKATPTKAGYSFSPASYTFNSPHTRANFDAASTASLYTVSGKVSNSTGAAISGATVTLGSKTITTDTSGNYSITGVTAGTYTISAAKSGYSTVSRSITVNGNMTGQNFVLPSAPGKAWTFIVYGAADNDLNSYMALDMNEMVAAGYDADVNVVMLYDGNGSTGSSYQVLTSTGWVTKVNLSEVDTGNPATLTNFLNWVKQNYPAQKYALDLWNHGGGFKYLPKGAAKGIGWDYTNNYNFLTMPELRTAIAASGIPKIDLVGTDACLMAMLEVAYEIKDNSTVFVASEQVIPGYGWPYTPIINSLDPGSTVTATQLGTTIVNSYIATYTSDSQLSLTNQTKVSALATAVNNLATLLKNNVNNYRTNINTARNASQTYDDPEYIDLYDFTLKLDTNCAGMSGLASATAAVRTALTSAVIANKYTSPLTSSHGLTIWIPQLGTSSFSTTMTTLYKPTKFATDTQWDEFLVAFMAVPAYTVSGKVTHSSTGAVISGATVTLGSKTASTDASGNYTITGVAPGTYTLSAAKSGYTTSSRSLTVNGNLTNQNLALTPVSTVVTFQALGGGATQSLSRFNGKKIYTMITAQPTSKPEGYGSPSTMYNYNLTTQAATAAVAGNSFKLSEGKYAFNTVYAKNQLTADEQMRQQELKLLASKSKQYNPTVDGISKSAPKPISVGSTWNNVYIQPTNTRINTTCRYISNYAYFFVDNRNVAAMESYLASYGAAFDQIYLKNKSKFGNVNDVDQNGKVIIVFSQELSGGLLGYFWAVDKYPTSTYSQSNQGDIFYMTTTSSYQGNVVKGTLAHELQHMIFFDQHYNNGAVDSSGASVWLNEALSQAAEYYNGYLDNHQNWIRSYLNGGWPGLSLTHWTSGNYGYGAIFIRYLIDQYGDTAIKNMCATGNLGVKAVESATGADFNVIYNNFTRALVMSGTGDSTNQLYNFKTLNLQQVQPSGRGGLTTTTTYNAGDDPSGSLFPYRIFFSQWTGSFGTMNLSGASINGTAFGLSR